MVESTRIQDVAYAAGFIDGEGCFHIARGFKTFQCVVDVSNTNKEPLVLLQQLFGGNLGNKVVLKNPRAKPCYYYRVQKSGEIIRLIETVMPHLIVKKPQATLMLNFLRTDTTRMGVIRTAEQRALMTQVFKDMALLNKRGA